MATFLEATEAPTGSVTDGRRRSEPMRLPGPAAPRRRAPSRSDRAHHGRPWTLSHARRHRDGVGSGGKRAGDPEAEVVVPVVGVVPVADIGRPPNLGQQMIQGNRVKGGIWRSRQGSCPPCGGGWGGCATLKSWNPQCVASIPSALPGSCPGRRQDCGAPRPSQSAERRILGRQERRCAFRRGRFRPPSNASRRRLQ